MLNYFEDKDTFWDGPDIPCIGLCKGDTISQAVYKLAKKLCELFDELELNNLNYSCIIDKAKVTNDINLFLYFSILLENDCKIKKLIEDKLDSIDNTELLVDNIDLKCFLQSYLDSNCVIIRFYNQLGSTVDPNSTGTVFQRSPINSTTAYYVSDLNQSVWQWDGLQYVPSTADLNSLCICDIENLELDISKVIQVIIDNLCQTKSSGIIKACDITFKVVPFSTTDPNVTTTVFTGAANNQLYYYISEINHKIWRWVPSQNKYIPSLLSSANIDLSSLDACLFNAETDLQNWINLYNVYTEPLITSCLTTNPIALSGHVVNVSDAAICNLQSIVGTPRDVYYSHLNECKEIIKFTGLPNSPNMVILGSPNLLNAFYVNDSLPVTYFWNGFQYAPFTNNVFFTEVNQWVDLCNLLNRVKKIETTCCTPTCDNTTVGFSSTYNSEDNTFTLIFNKASGTNISSEFTDCGSVLTATDHKGNKITLDIVLTQDTEIELDVSSLDISKSVLINIKSCLSDGILTCKNCITESLPPIETCGLCKICAIDSSDTGKESIKVYYTVASNPTVVQETTLYGGQCLTFALPEDKPTIKSILPTAPEIVLENDSEYPCNDIEIPAPVADTCWFFPLPTTSSPARINIDRGLVGASFQMLPDFQLITPFEPDYTFTYDKLYVYQHPYPNGITLTGPVDNNLSVSGSFISADTTKWENVRPTNVYTTSSLIKFANICTDSGFEGEWKTFGTFPIPNSLNSNGNGAFSAIGVSGSVNKDVDYTRTKVGTGKTGLILRLANQPTNISSIQLPEISLIEPISGNKIFLKGELIADDCQCPT